MKLTEKERKAEEQYFKVIQTGNYDNTRDTDDTYADVDAITNSEDR